ncbi:phospholipase D family protein [Variovorax dokdonensis]|uniref:Phospholipase D family protein n=1 Tax=Variovorax dokdonensis TaxID=344883 RepID=A0ABT7NGK0_9BURK|nr:phospholipase D family protein [Variovorax dokdonensis]
MPPSSGSPLVELTDRLRPKESATGSSGFLLLEGPQAAYGARLALIDAARQTLDLQYYAIHVDASTGRLVRGLRAAARRGVRVRILLDDLHSTGRDALIMRLAFENNIEVRMFNPVPGGRRSMASRLFGALEDPDQMQQRMHNKLFVADNAMAVTGGRNLGDAYFGNSDDANFVDVDVLAAGPVVASLSKSFDAYWNDERAYPAQSLISPKELEQIRDEARKESEQRKDERPAPGQGPTPESTAPADLQEREREAEARSERRRRAWDEQAMDLRTVKLSWAPAAVLADPPEKIGSDKETETAQPKPDLSQPDASRVAKPGAAVKASQAPGQVQDEVGVVDSLLHLFRQARRELVIVSPYFVPGQDMLDALADARKRGVRVRLLTNSLASNDAVAAHAGYVRHRDALLNMGVELFELRSEGSSGLGAFGSSGTGSSGASRSMLHSKVLTLDGQWLVIGSMNLDLRSQLQNTELALLIHSPDLAKDLNERFGTTAKRSAWHLEKDEQGQLVWHAPEGSGLPDARTEPDTTLGQRVMMHLLGPLAPQRLL